MLPDADIPSSGMSDIVTAPEAFDPLVGPATIPAQLAESARLFADQTYLIGEDGAKLSFVETQSRARTAARAFISAGVELGDRVAIWAPNSLGWIIACLGLQLAGGILVPLNTRFKGEEAASVLEKSRARLLVTVGEFVGNHYPEMLRAVRPAGIASLERIVLLEAWEAFTACCATTPRGPHS